MHLWASAHLTLRHSYLLADVFFLACAYLIFLLIIIKVTEIQLDLEDSKENMGAEVLQGEHKAHGRWRVWAGGWGIPSSAAAMAW